MFNFIVWAYRITSSSSNSSFYEVYVAGTFRLLYYQVISISSTTILQYHAFFLCDISICQSTTLVTDTLFVRYGCMNCTILIATHLISAVSILHRKPMLLMSPFKLIVGNPTISDIFDPSWIFSFSLGHSKCRILGLF